MTGEKAEFVNLFAKDVGHPLIATSCIMQWKPMCAKASLKELWEVMQTVTKVVNYISAQALNNDNFKFYWMK